MNSDTIIIRKRLPSLCNMLFLLLLCGPVLAQSGAINSGGGDYQSSGGISFNADEFFLAGRSNDDLSTTAAIGDTLDPALFQRAREGATQYQIPVENGLYKVTFYFAEIAGLSAGERVFDVSIEGVGEVDNLDVASTVGINQALTVDIDDVSVVDGQLDITFVEQTGNPLINAISYELLLAAPVVDAGRDLVLDATGSAQTLSLAGVASSVNGDVQTSWSVLQAPGAVEFADSASLASDVSLQESGLYILRLSADDGQLQSTDDVAILVGNTTITTAQGNGADASVALVPGSGNFGAQERMIIRQQPGNFRNKLYLRFDLSTLPGGIDAAALALNVVGIPGNSGVIGDYRFSIYGVEEAFDYGYRRLDETWQEGSGTDGNTDATLDEISWGQAPGNSRFSNAPDERFSRYLGEFRSFRNRQRVESVATDALRDFLREDSNGLVTLIVIRETSTSTQSFIASKELAATSDFFAPSLKLVTSAETNRAPLPKIAADVRDGEQGFTVVFDASATIDPDGTVESYRWAFGDGTPDVITQAPTVTHTFDDAGIFPVALKATDDQDLESTNPAYASITSRAVWDDTQEDARFPVDAQVLNVKHAPFLAKGDGVTDDTAAIQAALDFFGSQRNALIYLPKGTYLISDTLLWPATLNEDGTREFGGIGDNSLTIMQGESREETIIRLADNADGFVGAASGKPLVDTGGGVAQRFRNSIRNMTFHTGNGNPGATGLEFQASNQGVLKNLLIIAGDGDGDGIDGDGIYGLNLRNNEVGPFLVKDVEIRGFAIGVSTLSTQNSVTFEGLTLIDQTDIGFQNARNAVFIHDLVVENRFARPAITNSNNGGSFVTLVDASITNTGVPGTGIGIRQVDTSNGFPSQTPFFVRNVTINHYETAFTVLAGFKDPFPPDAGGTAYVAEFVNDPSTNNEVQRLWPNTETSLNLPIEEPPVIPWGASSGWKSVIDFLTPEQRRQFRDIDLTDAIQAALDSGAQTIYFPRAGNEDRLLMNGNVTVPATVRRIIGLETNLSGTGKFILPAGIGTEPIEFERIYPIASGIEHKSERTVIVRHSLLRYAGKDGAGDFFAEDVVGGYEFGEGQKAWLRQLNSECLTPRVLNEGAQVWIFGMKTECVGPVIETYEGGATELLGTFFYTNDGEFQAGEPWADASLPAFRTIDSSISVSGHREQNFLNAGYTLVAEETRNGETRTITAPGTGGVVASNFQLYVGYSENDPANNKAPVVNAGPDLTLESTNASSVALAGTINDDGFPNQGTTLTSQWSLVSGPGTATFGDEAALQTHVTFSEPGRYVLRLTAFEGDLVDDLSGFDELFVDVFSSTIDTRIGEGADATIDFGPAEGLSSTLAVRFNNFPSKAYVRFDVSNVNLQDLANVGVFFDMTGSSVFVVDATYNVFGLIESDSYGEGVQNEHWDEATLVYADAPGHLTTSGGGVYDSSIPDSAGVLSDFTVHLGQFQSRQRINETLSLNSQALLDFIQADTNGVVTLIITREESISNSGITLRLSSKEGNGVAPYLGLSEDSDFDNDGLPNSWERDNGFDIFNASDASLDADGDGLTNAEEFDLGTDPNNSDTDGDGVSDFDEVAANTDPVNPNDFPVIEELSGYWPLNGDFNDTTGNSVSAASPGLMFGLGVLDRAADFNGESDRIDLSGLEVDGSGITISAWINADDFDVRDARIFSQATGTSNDAHDLMFGYWRTSNATRLRFRIKTEGETSSFVAPSGNLIVGEWFHVAATWNGNLVTLYENGIAVGSFEKSGAFDNTSGILGAIGNQPTGAGDRAFDGRIDDVRLYNRALSQTEINDLVAQVNGANNLPPVVLDDQFAVPSQATFNAPAPGVLVNDGDPNGDTLNATLVTSATNGLVVLNQDGSFDYTPSSGFSGLDSFVYQVNDGELTSLDVATVNLFVGEFGEYASWLMNESGGVVIGDDTEGQFNGSLVAGAVRVPDGVSGNAVEFDGESAGIEVAPFDVLGEGLTLSAWINADDFDTDDARIISKATGTSSNSHYWMLSTRSSRGEVKLRFRLKTDGVTREYVSEDAISAGQYSHVAASWTGDLVTLYINGVPSGRFSQSGVIDTNDAVGVGIGNQPLGAGNKPFDGLIDEVRIFNRGLSDIEVAQLAAAIVGSAAPNVLDDVYTIEVDSTLVVDSVEGVLANDLDLQGDAITAQVVTAPSSGSLTLNNDGSFTYQPNAGFEGIDTFTYQATDGANNSVTATVTLVVGNAQRNAAFEFDEETVVSIAGGAQIIDGELIVDGIDGLAQVNNLDLPGSAFSASVRFKANDFDVNDARLFSKAHSGTGSNNHIWMLSTRRSGGEIRLRFRLKTSQGNTETYVVESASLVAGEWVHAAVTWDGQLVRLYQDGSQVGVYAQTGSIEPAPDIAVGIGNQPDGAGNKPFDGIIDDVYFYQRVLSLAEIEALAQQQ